MKKMITVLGLVLAAYTAQAQDVQFSPEVQQAISDAKFDKNAFKSSLESALDRAAIRTNVRVYCSRKGFEFTTNLANDIRKTVDFVPKTSGTDISKLEKSTEAAAVKYENFCESAVARALSSGMSEQEVIELIKTSNAN